MHTLAAFIQVARELAGGLTLEHVSTGLLMYQQLQLSQMKVKVEAIWERFLGDKAEKDKDSDSED